MASVTIRPNECVFRNRIGQSTSTVLAMGDNSSTHTNDLALMGQYLRDDLTTTWIELELVNTTVTNCYSSYSLQSVPTLPVGARVTQVSWSINFARPSGVSGTSAVYGGCLAVGSNASPTTYTNKSYTTNPAVGAFTSNTAAGSITTAADEGLITQNVLNSMHLGLVMADTDPTGTNRLRATEGFVTITYDEIPVVSNVSPGASGGQLVDTQTPVISWTYSDDLQPQTAFQVEVLDSTGASFEDSGAVASASTTYQVQRALTIGASYTVRVRARQSWSGPGGEFWSDWAYSPGAMVAATVSVPDVQITNNPDATKSAIEVKTQPNINLLSYQAAAFEQKFAEWVCIGGGTMTQNSNTTYVRDGAGSARIEQTDPLTTVDNKTWIPVTEGQRFSVAVWHKFDAATTVGSAQVAVYAQFWSSAAGYIQYNEGAGVTGDKTQFVKSELLVTVPSGAAWMNIGFYVPSAGGGIGKVFYADSAHVIELQSGDNSYSEPSRGGLLRRDFNLLNETDSDFESAPLNWTPSSTGVTGSISSSQSRSGGSSMLLYRSVTGATKVYLAGTTVAAPDVANPGYLHTFVSIRPTDTLGTATVGIEWRDANGSVVTTTSASLGTPTANTWTDNQAATALPSNSSISYGVPYFNFTAQVGGSSIYLDALTFGIKSDVTAIGFQRGKRTFSGPYYVVEALDVPGFPEITQAEFAALSVSSPSLFAELVSMIEDRYTEANNGYVGWQKVAEDDISFDEPEKTLYDRSCKSGTARMYRGYAYAYDNGVLLRSGDDYLAYDPGSLVAPSTVSWTAAGWLSSVENRRDTVTNEVLEDGYDAYKFTTIQYGTGDEVGVEASSIKLAGRKFPVASYGSGESKSLSVSLLLLDAAAEAAIERLLKRKTLLLYRDGRGQRIKGVITSLSYSSEKGYRSCSFNIVAHGDQFE